MIGIIFEIITEIYEKMKITFHLFFLFQFELVMGNVIPNGFVKEQMISFVMALCLLCKIPS